MRKGTRAAAAEQQPGCLHAHARLHPCTPAHSQADMRVILKARLAKAECVAAKDKEAAVELLLKKSEVRGLHWGGGAAIAPPARHRTRATGSCGCHGVSHAGCTHRRAAARAARQRCLPPAHHTLPPQGQFIYAKFAFDALRERPAWSLQALEDELPSGLSGQYRSVMATLRQALQDERPDLLTLLRGRVLPILVAAREPLTGGQLALLAKANAADVRACKRVCACARACVLQPALEVFKVHARLFYALPLPRRRWTSSCTSYPTSSLAGPARA